MVDPTVKQLNEIIEKQNLTIEKEDLKWSTVTLSEVIDSGGSRLEASVFGIQSKHMRDNVLNGKYPVVELAGENGLIKNSYYPGRFKRIYTGKSGIPFYLPSQMTEINPRPQKYISSATNCSIEDLTLKENTLLLTRSGTIGNVTIVTKTLKGKVFSDDVIRTSFKNEEDLGFVYIYLKSNTGKTLLKTNSYGSVITHIEPDHLKKMIIPNPPSLIKYRIHSLAMESYQLLDESNELIENATKIMAEELDLPSIEELMMYNNSVSSQVSDSINDFEVKLSDLDQRLDASYHLPIVDKLMRRIQKKAEIKRIGDKGITNGIILAGVFKRVYVEKDYGIPFLGGADITHLNPEVEKFLSKPHHEERYEKELKVEENWILVTNRGTIGTVSIVPKHFEGWAVSQNVLKVVPSGDDVAGYIYVFLNSEWGKVFIDREIYGSVVNMIDNNSLSEVPIPIMENKAVQKEINSLALKANKLRYQAFKLEQKAINIMNKDVLDL